MKQESNFEQLEMSLAPQQADHDDAVGLTYLL